MIEIYPPIAQLDRAPGFEPGCREFESLWARQFTSPNYFYRTFNLARGTLAARVQSLWARQFTAVAFIAPVFDRAWVKGIL